MWWFHRAVGTRCWGNCPNSRNLRKSRRPASDEAVVEAKLPLPATTMARAPAGLRSEELEVTCKRCGRPMLHERDCVSPRGIQSAVWRCWCCYRDVILTLAAVPAR